MHDHSQYRARQQPEAREGGFFTSRAFFVFLGFLVMAVVLLLSEHRAHFLGALPFLFLLACPLLHAFMHRGHGTHGGGRPGEPGRGEQP